MDDIDFASYDLSSDNIEDVIRIIENDSIKLFKWFCGNMMSANKDKCHLIVSMSHGNWTI